MQRIIPLRYADFVNRVIFHILKALKCTLHSFPQFHDQFKPVSVQVNQTR